MNKLTFSKLLEPGYIGRLKVKNRMVKMGSHPGEYPYEDGNVPQRIIDIYAALAKGGLGLCTTGCGACDQYNGGVAGHGYLVDDDKFIPSMSQTG